MWSIDDIHFVLNHDASQDPVATVEVHTPNGIVLIMGEPRREGRSLIVAGVHVQGVGLGRNNVSPVNLRVIVDAFLKDLDYDDIVVEGGVRTTGANPGRRPRPIRFARRPGVAAKPKP